MMTTGGAAMVSVRLTDWLCTALPESVTLKVSAALASTAEGVPAMVPVDGFKDRPAGRVPAVRDQVNGVVPPVAASVAE